MSPRLELLEVIGRGGFGTVHRAWLHGEGLRREVAVKLLRPEHAGSEAIQRRLRDEARLLAAIDHRAVVRVEDLVRLGDTVAVVMELVRGRPLSELLASEGPIPPGPALELVREVAGALATAWSAPGPEGAPLRLVHRDIKPANLLLTPSGEVRLLDFGIARGELATREALTTTVAYGTPEYMAPERFDGQDLPAGDVYSLGCVLLEALTGRPPERSSAREERHLELWADALERLAAQGLEPELVGLVGELLAYDPAARPNAAALTDRCADLLYRGGTAPLARWARQHVAPVETGLEAPEAPPSTPERREAAPPTQRRTGRLALLAGAGLVGLIVVGASLRSPQEAPVVEVEAVPLPVEPQIEAAPPPPEAETPAPTPQPAPVHPRPAVVAPPETVEIALTGGASGVALLGAAGRLPLPGAVPPGRYEVIATFGEAGEMTCGRVEIRATGPHTLHTDPAFTSCELR